MYQILVVDDSMIIRNKISRLPKNAGFNIIASARNGLEAIEKHERYKPDIVTLDLTMPEMDGLQTIPKLVASNPKLLILVISALSDQATGLEALELGASGFLNKPFNEGQLINALERMVKYAARKGGR